MIALDTGIEKKLVLIGKEELEVTTYFEYLNKFSIETFNHSLDVCLLCQRVADSLKLTGDNRIDLLTAALYHDIGKACINIDILNKPGKLTTDEYTNIKIHPVLSYIITKHEGFNENVQKGVLQHHENDDGTGYPYGYSRTKISDIAAIIHIADVWSALVMPRCYKLPSTPEAAKEIMRKDQRMFNDKYLNVFLDIM